MKNKFFSFTFCKRRTIHDEFSIEITKKNCFERLFFLLFVCLIWCLLTVERLYSPTIPFAKSIRKSSLSFLWAKSNKNQIFFPIWVSTPEIVDPKFEMEFPFQFFSANLKRKSTQSLNCKLVIGLLLLLTICPIPDDINILCRWF